MEGSGQSRSGSIGSRVDLDRVGRALPAVIAAAIAAVLLAKLFLAWRINVNWDEFLYLSHVHALARDELNLLLQGAYAHLFRWIVGTEANEVDQVVLLRLPMWLLLALSAWLIYRLARRFASPSAAAFAVLAFVGSWPALKHGASFRADSMLLPLTLGTLLAVVRVEVWRTRNGVLAGLCLGAALVLTVKAALFLPVMLAMILFPDRAGSAAGGFHPGQAFRRTTIIAVVAAVLAASLITLHATQVVAGTESATSFAARTMAATLVDIPFMPRGDYFRSLIADDPVYWLAAAAGLLVAVRIRAYDAVAAVLALLPILFYRNAFPYFYPVMMAPPAILVALAADRLLGTAQVSRRRGLGLFAFAALGLLLARSSWNGVMTLRFDEQQGQRAVIAAVHRVFPDPVPYLDHSGMIASFPKANFFMSSWGVENYLRRERDFMPEALASRHPPLLLVNHGVLRPGSLLFRKLREADRQLLVDSYVDYWGPIRVAGVAVRIPAEGSARERLPFPGRYRIEAAADVVVNGRRLRPGESFESGAAVEVELRALPGAAEAIDARLVWADARKAPAEAPPRLPLYSPL